jgi:hypothetical protein
MKRTLIIFSSLILVLSFCGKKGPIQPPVIKVPQKIENLEAKQRGDNILLRWANPTAYSDGSPLSEIKEIEIWLLEETEESEESAEESSSEKKKASPKISMEKFREKSKLEKVIKKDEFSDYRRQFNKDSFEFECWHDLPEVNFTLKRFIFALKVKDSREKSSEFSKLLSVKPRIVPLPPQEVQSALYEDRIEVRWKKPEKNIDNSTPAEVRGYNLYRRKEGEFFSRLNSSLIIENRYSDKDFRFGEVYHYMVRASCTKSSPFWESADSGTAEILTEDIFAPAPPSGLISVAGEDFISLSWDINKEKDLLGYNVWRKEEGQGEYIPLTPQPIQENVYNDYAVEMNKRYYYAITAQDIRGNESEKSETVAEEIKEKL